MNLQPRIQRSFSLIFVYSLLLIGVLFVTSGDRYPGIDFTGEAASLALGNVITWPSSADLLESSQMVAGRTANTATFDLGHGRYSSVIATDPLHYLDEGGEWQPIDPAFRPLQDSFVVEHNLIRSRAGKEQAWLTAAAGETAVSWQADTLGAVGKDGHFIAVARGVTEAAATVDLRQDGRVLHYANGWNDPALAEEISSAPGALEHTLILTAPPQAGGTPQFLALRATLRLLPGAQLWAESQARSDAFVTDGALEIRDAQGRVSLVFDPVLAFEQENHAVATTGQYAVRPGDEAETWTVEVRTPWDWWADPARAYPAVLDPTIRVQTSTGFAHGLAWVRSNDNQDYTIGEMILGAHVPNWQTKTRGYVQFNSLPALLTNANVQVKSATLEVTPTAMWFPTYYWKGKGFTDWDSVHIKRGVQLNYVGACPADCNNFSLHDDRIGNDPGNQFNWNNSLIGTPVEPGVKKQLVAGTGNDGLAKKTTTTWNVTGAIQQWYKDWHAGPYPRSFPTFMLEFTKTCGTNYTANGTYINFDSLEVGNCTWFGMFPGDIRLLIEYEPLPLSPGSNTLLNQPGVPSYLSGVFENSDDYDTNHEYDLNPGSGGRWRAIAVRGNHAVEEEPTVPTRASLQLWDDGGQSQMLASVGSAEPDTTSFLFIDDHHSSGIGTADLHVEVTPTDKNDFSQDQERNYRLHYAEAAPVTFVNGKAIAGDTFSSAKLIWLTEFHLVQGDNLTVKVNAPEALDVILIEPAAGSGKGAAVNPTLNGDDKFTLDGSGQRTLFYPAPRTGTYALALVNKERPLICVDPEEYDCVPGEVVDYFPAVNLKVCPEGSIPVDKFEEDGVSCQPIRLPDGATPSRPMPYSGGSLTVYSEGGFSDDPSTGNWCTTGEIQGAPIIDSGVSGRWVAVVQGSVCYNQEAGIFKTTDDSAVGLIVPAKTSPPGDPRGQPWPGFIYGVPTLPVGPSDGIVFLNSDGRLLPEDSVGKPTLHNIRPLDAYWQEEYTPGAPIDYINTAEMRAYGQGQGRCAGHDGRRPTGHAHQLGHHLVAAAGTAYGRLRRM